MPAPAFTAAAHCKDCIALNSINITKRRAQAASKCQPILRADVSTDTCFIQIVNMVWMPARAYTGACPPLRNGLHCLQEVDFMVSTYANLRGLKVCLPSLLYCRRCWEKISRSHSSALQETRIGTTAAQTSTRMQIYAVYRWRPAAHRCDTERRPTATQDQNMLRCCHQGPLVPLGKTIL